MDDKLFEKLKIAFKYGIKVTEKHPENDDCDDAYFDTAIAVINRVYPRDGSTNNTSENSLHKHFVTNCGLNESNINPKLLETLNDIESKIKR